jgi:hypothetical protein
MGKITEAFFPKNLSPFGQYGDGFFAKNKQKK